MIQSISRIKAKIYAYLVMKRLTIEHYMHLDRNFHILLVDIQKRT